MAKTSKPTNGDTMRASALARKLNTLMGERRMSRAAFADAAGISEATLSRTLAGKGKMRESTLRYMEARLALPNMYFSTNIKNPVPDDKQCVLEVPEPEEPKHEEPKPEPKPERPKRIILSWKSVSGEEEETEIVESPHTFCGNLYTKTPKGSLTLSTDKLIWWSVEEV